MIINKNSPLRKIPTKLEPGMVLVIDSLRNGIEMIEIAYQRLLSSVLLVSKSRDEDSKKAVPFPDIFLDIWSIIDSTNRVRKLLNHLCNRGHNGKKSEEPKESIKVKKENALTIKEFIERTNYIKDLRDTMQHLNAKIDKFVSKKKSIWGTLVWIYFNGESQNNCFIDALLPGAITDSSSDLINPAGKQLKLGINYLTLKCLNHSLCFEILIDDIKMIVKNLERQLAPQFEGQPTFGVDLFMRYYIRMQ